MAKESDYNSYKALTVKSMQACEFCDQTFSNRFSSIVHNSSHIIIPLSKHLDYCEMCYTYFNSTSDFDTHMSNTHCPVISNDSNDIAIDINIPEIKSELLPQLNGDNALEVKEETFGGDEYDSSSEDEFLLDIVKREAERCYIQDDIFKREAEKSYIHDDIDKREAERSYIQDDIVKSEAEKNYIQDELKNEENYTDFIKSQLKFEVDHDSSGLMKDCEVAGCEVNIQYTWKNSQSEDSETYKNTKSLKNSIVYEEPVDVPEFENIIVTDDPVKCNEEYKSIHYSDLMNFGFYSCKYCYAYFSNRFTLIVHETTHMRIKKDCKRNLLCPQCDIYIAGNYRTVQKHETAVHGALCSDKTELRTCDTCGLKYRKYLRHIKNYHPKEYEHLEEAAKKKMSKELDEINQESVQEPIQDLGLESVRSPVRDFFPKPILVTLLESFQSSNWVEKSFTIKVCDLCYSFFKSSFKKTYILIGIFSYTTERPCDECKNLFFKLKTVRTIIRTQKSQMNRGSARGSFKNEKRLKKIQVRLKMMNKLGKC